MYNIIIAQNYVIGTYPNTDHPAPFTQEHNTSSIATFEVEFYIVNIVKLTNIQGVFEIKITQFSTV